METFLIICELAAVVLLLTGYRRAAKKDKGETSAWLFAYKTEKLQKATLTKPVKK